LRATGAGRADLDMGKEDRSASGHAITRAQRSGFGPMLSFDIEGDVEEKRRFVETVELFTLAEPLGGVNSLVSHSATMTHASMSLAARREAGISDTLPRLSIGLENEADLLDDLARDLDPAR
jgi:cystathionine gamma-synthase